jgi:hypothetical protein
LAEYLQFMKQVMHDNNHRDDVPSGVHNSNMYLQTNYVIYCYKLSTLTTWKSVPLYLNNVNVTTTTNDSMFSEIYQGNKLECFQISRIICKCNQKLHNFLHRSSD